jgi:hypothetical protein
MLLHVRHECVRFVNRSARLVVRLDADMMEEHQLYARAWEVVKELRLLVLPLCTLPFVLASFVWAPFVSGGEHMASFADLPVEGSICAQGK